MKYEVSLAATHQLPIDPYPRIQAVCFANKAQGLTWLEDLIAGEEFQRLHRKLILASGIVIDSPYLDEVLASKQREPIDDRYHRQNLQFRKGPWHERAKDSVEAKPIKEPKPVKEPRAIKPDGYITVAEIAAELGCKPFDVRQALRNSGAKKPDFGWAFSPDEVKAVKKLVANKS